MWCRGVGLITTLILSLLATPLATDAQQATKVHRIGLLRSGSPISDKHLLEAFRQGLRELDYIEGQNLVIEDRYAEGRDERLPDLATELVRRQVDIIVAGGSNAIRAAQDATRTIPIVMAGTGDPVGQGLIASLAHPGGNITGLSALGVELPGKRLELLKETVPQSTRIAVLISADRPGYASAMRNLTVAATALGLHLHVVELRHADELDSAFAAMTQARADALLVIDDSQLLNRQRARVVANLAAQHRLPAMHGWREYVDAGLLMSYGPSQLDMQRRAAVYVAKILYERIRSADAVVADTMHCNPNVLYEIGYAHALGRPTILVTRAGETLPFDLQSKNHIFYSSIVELREKLAKRLEATIGTPRVAGLPPGAIWTSDDFDEPLPDDFWTEGP